MRPSLGIPVLLLTLTLAAAPALAQDDCLPAGSDLWSTPATGTHATIRAGFLCTGSPAFDLAFQGVPLLASPPLGPTDTVISRGEACFSNNAAEAEISLAAVSLRATQQVNLADYGCGNGLCTVTVRRDVGAKSPRRITIVRTGTHGGTFTGLLAVPVEIVFACPGGPRVLRTEIEFEIESGAWASEPGSGAPVVEGDLLVDTNGDGRLTDEEALPGNAGGFHPGFSGATTWPPVPVPVRHEAPQHSHFTWPPVPHRPPTCDVRVVRYLRDVVGFTEARIAGAVQVIGIDEAEVLETRKAISLLPCTYADTATEYVIGQRKKGL